MVTEPRGMVPVNTSETEVPEGSQIYVQKVCVHGLGFVGLHLTLIIFLVVISHITIIID